MKGLKQLFCKHIWEQVGKLHITLFEWMALVIRCHLKLYLPINVENATKLNT